VLPAGALVMIHPEAGATLEQGPAPWMPSKTLTDLSADELIEAIRAELSDLVSSALELPAERYLADLTGGKDSRLVLATALLDGVADRFTFRTIGPSDLGDVRIAVQIAERLALQHVAELPFVRHDKSYAERIRDFVGVTAGMTNIWDLKTPLGAPPEVRVSGLNGECLRTHYSVRRPVGSSDDLIELFDTEIGFGRLRLLRPAVEQQFRSIALAALQLDPTGDSDPLDLLESFYIRYRARSRYGPLDELETDLRILGLYSIDAIRAAFALGADARHRELVHFKLIRRASEALARCPFAGVGWSDQQLAELGSAADDSATGRAPAEPATTGDAEPLMARLQRRVFSERREAFAEVLADESNPAWELIDRDRARGALDHLESLTGRARGELFGAVTAALWLGDEVSP
jgi:hypothetical protein